MSSYVGQAFDRLDDCIRLKVKGNITANMGDIAVLNAGYLDVGSAATGLKIVGTFAEDVDTTGASDGDLFRDQFVGPMVNVPKPDKLFWFDNATGGDAIVQADCGAKPAYINGARSVTDTTTSRSLAGDIIKLSSDGLRVCVAIKPLGAA
jgi:hypothetical protein